MGQRDLATYLLDVIPGYLRGFTPYLRSFGQEADSIVDKLLDGVRAGRLEDCDGADLDRHGRNRRLPRAHGESDAAYRAYLRTTWDCYRRMGSVAGLQRQLAHLGYPTSRVITRLDLYLAGHTSAFGGYEGFYYVEIDTPNAFTLPSNWDGGDSWDASEMWDLGEPYPGGLADILATIRRWKPVGRSCRFVRIRVGTIWITVPVAERWEYTAAGNIRDIYLYHW